MASMFLTAKDAYQILQRQYDRNGLISENDGKYPMIIYHSEYDGRICCEAFNKVGTKTTVYLGTIKHNEIQKLIKFPNITITIESEISIIALNQGLDTIKTV